MSTGGKDPSMFLLDLMYGLGDFLLADDIHDFGKFSTKSHPSPLHHWQYGFLMRETANILGHAQIASQAMQDLNDKDELDLIIEHFESIAYAGPTLD